LGQHVKIGILRQELDLHTVPDLLPGETEQRLFELAQPPLGRADQVRDRGIGLPHLGEHLLGRDTAVHHPDALRLAVLGLDLARESAQRRVVRGVPRQHLIG
jgi:hypothetical protein